MSWQEEKEQVGKEIIHALYENGILCSEALRWGFYHLRASNLIKAFFFALRTSFISSSISVHVIVFYIVIHIHILPENRWM